MMLLLAGIFLFPGIYLMYDSGIGSITFILAALFALLVIIIAVFGIIVIFRYHSFFTLTEEGVEFNHVFYRWEDIRSYQMITEKDRYFSNETNTYQENETHAIILTLEDDNSIRISADKLSKKPAEIIRLFDLYNG